VSALVASPARPALAPADLAYSGTQDALTAVLTLVAAVILTCAAMFLEYCCRVPDDPERGQRD
jgi:hypothetical protein